MKRRASPQPSKVAKCSRLDFDWITLVAAFLLCREQVNLAKVCKTHSILLEKGLTAKRDFYVETFQALKPHLRPYARSFFVSLSTSATPPFGTFTSLLRTDAKPTRLSFFQPFYNIASLSYLVLNSQRTLPSVTEIRIRNWELSQEETKRFFPNLRKLCTGINWKTEALPADLEELEVNNMRETPSTCIFPVTLRTLSFAFAFDCCSLSKFTLPPRLEVLILSRSYNEPIKKDFLPNTLRELVLGHGFCQSLDGVLPVGCRARFWVNR